MTPSDIALSLPLLAVITFTFFCATLVITWTSSWVLSPKKVAVVLSAGILAALVFPADIAIIGAVVLGVVLTYPYTRE